MTAGRAIVPASVLVAEDDWFIADEISFALERAGARVVGPLPDVGRALDRLAEGTDVEVAVLDIRLGADLVFPVADLLSREGVRLVFFSAYDELMVPPRFRDAVRVSKSDGVDALVRAVAEARHAAMLPADQVGADTPGVVDLLPDLRALARSLGLDAEAADDLVALTLQSGLAMLDRQELAEPTGAYLRRTLVDIHRSGRTRLQ